MRPGVAPWNVTDAVGVHLRIARLADVATVLPGPSDADLREIRQRRFCPERDAPRDAEPGCRRNAMPSRAVTEDPAAPTIAARVGAPPARRWRGRRSARDERVVTGRTP
jgi:hypothetical protein